MITLATLQHATAQQVFDQVKAHLLSMKNRSMGAQGCAYRGELGSKCAAGCLIADDEYVRTLESYNWEDLSRMERVPSYHAELISQLQWLHDILRYWGTDGLNQLGKDRLDEIESHYCKN